jgi:hypothetical protein
MIHDKKEFGLGLTLIASFFLILAVIMMPLFAGGRNSLDFLDSTFNSISKNSAYYIPDVAKKAKQHDGTAVTIELKAADAGQAARMQKLLAAGGATVAAEGATLKVGAELGPLLANVLDDADLMFKNEGKTVAAKYGYEEKRVLYDWHKALGAMTKDLNRQGKFKEAKTLRDVQTKAIEPAYNYYGVKAVPMSDMIWVALAALVGYVIYTVWYGYAILFLFEGWGLKLEH